MAPKKKPVSGSYSRPQEGQCSSVSENFLNDKILLRKTFPLPQRGHRDNMNGINPARLKSDMLNLSS